MLKLTDKLDLRRGEFNNRFKISAPTWNDKFELPGYRILHQIFKAILSIF